MRISDWSSDVCSSDLHDYDLNGKRIAVIGTGASAIQFVPQIVPKVAHLDLFQRTPPWIMPKPDREISARERKLFRLLPFTQKLMRAGLYTMLETRVLGFVVNPKLMSFRSEEHTSELQSLMRISYAVFC